MRGGGHSRITGYDNPENESSHFGMLLCPSSSLSGAKINQYYTHYFPEVP